MTEPMWTTEQGEPVRVGDCVALDLLHDKEAVARIVERTATGLIRVRYVESSKAQPGKVILVEEAQLLMFRPEGECTCATTTTT